MESDRGDPVVCFVNMTCKQQNHPHEAFSSVSFILECSSAVLQSFRNSIFSLLFSASCKNAPVSYMKLELFFCMFVRKFKSRNGIKVGT